LRGVRGEVAGWIDGSKPSFLGFSWTNEESLSSGGWTTQLTVWHFFAHETYYGQCTCAHNLHMRTSRQQGSWQCNGYARSQMKHPMQGELDDINILDVQETGRFPTSRNLAGRCEVRDILLITTRSSVLDLAMLSKRPHRNPLSQ
jgi:hypothetical protein